MTHPGENFDSERVQELESALREYENAAEWLICRLDDVINEVPVRGLDEAFAGYEAASKRARSALSEPSSSEEGA